MMQSLSTAVTGLSAFSQEIAVISNNVANSETSAYKASDVSFSDVLSQSLSGASGSSLGAGVSVSKVSETWTQGSITSTGNTTDLAINGSGFFMVADVDTGQTYYTRNGEFSFDDDGVLINSSGLAVQGYAIDEDGNLGSLTDITISYDASPANATSEISTTVNLDADAEVGDTYETSVTAYDSLGNEHNVTITYEKTDTNEWDYSISCDDGTVGGTGSTGTLTFNESGALVSGSNDPEFTITGLSGGAADMSISWDIADETSSSTYATNGSITQYSLNSALYNSSQDGYASGELSSISISSSGVVTGTYTNSAVVELYQIALADFNNYNGLLKVSGSLYSATSESGDAIIGIPGSGRFGTLSSKSLESSNVDLSTELASLITAQRAYQACSKVFSACDEILQTLINM
jgi:flagellar hook protein FlgE